METAVPNAIVDASREEQHAGDEGLTGMRALHLSSSWRLVL